MGDGRRPDSPLRADDGDHPSKGLGAGHAEQLRHRLNEVDDAKRGDEIFADPTRHQLPVEDDVVELAKDDHLGPCITIFSELFELP